MTSAGLDVLNVLLGHVDGFLVGDSWFVVHVHDRESKLEGC